MANISLQATRDRRSSSAFPVDIIGGGVQLEPLDIIARMDKTNTRLALFSTLLTLGIILMSFGIFWLMCFGVALCMLASYFSSRPRLFGLPRLTKFAIWVAVAVVLFVCDWHDGGAFAHSTPPLWFWLLLFGAWAWNIIDEFYRWRKIRRL